MFYDASSHESVKSTVDSLQTIYTVVLGLSLGEAFMQLVPEALDSAENPKKHSEHAICWGRVINLASFLLLIIPFFHGMNRYFFETYLKSDDLVPGYGGHLLLDSAAFTIEGSLFFILCRSLSESRWRRFYWTVIVLSALDLLWGAVSQYGQGGIQPWMVLDVAGIAAILALFAVFGSKHWFETKKRAGSVIGLTIVLVRTVADYWSSWRFYFPGSGR